MKNRTRRYRRTRFVALLLLGIVLVPYGFSRVASLWRCVTVHSLAEASTDLKEDSTIRIVSYNIAHGRGLAKSNWEGGTAEERMARLDQIAGLLRALDADIVVLNEVDFDSSWSFSTNQARYLAKRAGYSYWAEQRNLDFRLLTWKWRFGNAVLSKHPITQAHVVDLPGYSAVETLFAGKKRGVLCTIDANGRKVHVLGAHLSHRSEAIRVASANVIIEIASHETAPTIVAGDLNSTPTGFPHSRTDANAHNAIDLLDASALFQRRPEQPSGAPGELTFRSDKPRSIIDWILVPRNCPVIDYHVESSTLSDHRPVVADISLEPAAETMRRD